ncbi:MAG TPA: DMT family transporter [Coleofasciculaceae cyanobacterium]
MSLGFWQLDLLYWNAVAVGQGATQMTVLALGLVLLSALVHASWNLFAKRAGGGAAFVWLFASLSSLFYAPLAVAVFLLQQPHIGSTGLLFMAGSGLLHVVYFLLLQRGYEAGDLSVVYPLARGTGPLLSTTAAIACFQEHPTGLALIGILLIALGTFLLTCNSGTIWAANQRMAIAYGLLTGVIIAAYTLWDKQAVSTLMIPPILADYGSNLSRVALLTPIALHRWQSVRVTWQRHWQEAIAVSLLSPLAYILVLTALAFTPISYVAPMREISILVGVILGTRLLAEGEPKKRLMAAGIIVLGVVFLAIG